MTRDGYLLLYGYLPVWWWVFGVSIRNANDVRVGLRCVVAHSGGVLHFQDGGLPVGMTPRTMALHQKFAAHDARSEDTKRRMMQVISTDPSPHVKCELNALLPSRHERNGE